MTSPPQLSLVETRIPCPDYAGYNDRITVDAHCSTRHNHAPGIMQFMPVPA